MRYQNQELMRSNEKLRELHELMDKKMKLDKDITIEQLKNELLCKDHLIKEIVNKSKLQKESLQSITQENHQLREKLIQTRNEYSNISVNIVKNNQ